jgi:ABC-type antimicrobial peptide transport system permease subunit
MCDLDLTDGKLNGKGECLIHNLSAAEYGYKIGDYITFNDKEGNQLGKLKITGFFEIKYRNSVITHDWKFWIGSNPFYLNKINTFQRMIITDFNTVYYAYGNDENSKDFIERHEFNKYFAWYILDSPENYNAFIKETTNFNYDDMIGFHWDYYKYDRATEVPLQVINAMNIFTAIALALSGIIIIILTVYMLNERRYETGILYSLGANKLKIIINYFCEYIIFILIISFLSIFTGKFFLNITLGNAPFLAVLNIDYVPGISFLLSLFGFSLIIVFMSVIIITVYILRSSPSKLISTGR